MTTEPTLEERMAAFHAAYQAIVQQYGIGWQMKETSRGYQGEASIMRQSEYVIVAVEMANWTPQDWSKAPLEAAAEPREPEDG
jgi:hypothetical protein